MNDEAARQGRPDDYLIRSLHSIGRAGDEPTVEEIVARCRAVAAACGLAWIHELVRDECARIIGRATA